MTADESEGDAGGEDRGKEGDAKEDSMGSHRDGPNVEFDDLAEDYRQC